MIDFGKKLKVHAIRREGYQLMHDGIIELAYVEANGIRVDVPRLEKTTKTLTEKVRELKHAVKEDPIFAKWKKRFGEKANITSHAQLATMLFSELKIKPSAFTDKGKPSTDDEALQKIDLPFVKHWATMQRYEKARGTFLAGIAREVVDGRLHPSFNLHTARTYRSSSDSPNFQNFPVRDKEISKIIRSHFIPSPGCVLVENDFKGVEVGVSACYHKDPNFISYITTPGKDMHRDMAAQIYLLKSKEVHKDARYGAKNKFVFPQFYGDFYIACAKALWEWIDKGKLLAPNEESLYKHLERKGITELGDCNPEQKPRPNTFEAHLQQIEDDFWNNRFAAYGQWRKDWYKQYLDRGYFDLLSGFRVYGSFRRNQVTNYPVQGSAFHCLLWTLTQVNRALRKYNMKSMIVGQIHDSMLGDVRIDELTNYLEIVQETVDVKLRKHYTWINVPLEVECEISPEDGTWFDKRPIVFKDGRYFHPQKKEKFTTDVTRFLEILKQKELFN